MDKIEKRMEERLKAIRNIIKEHGYHGVTELKKYLWDEYKISSTRPTLYTDLKKIAHVPKDQATNIADEIIISMRRYKRINDEIINTTMDDRIKLQALRNGVTIDKELASIIKLLSYDVPKSKKDIMEVSFSDD